MSVEENTAVMRRLEAALNAGRADAGLALWAEQLWVNGQLMDAQTLVQLGARLWAAVPDIRWRAARIIAEGEWVAVHWSMHGTHTGDFAHPTFGTAPASGRTIQLTYMDHYRISDGRITEVWEVRDALALLQQFGLLSLPGTPPAR